jgi:hypothetical protein
MILFEGSISTEGHVMRELTVGLQLERKVRQFPLHQLIKEQGAETLALRHSIDLRSPLPFGHQGSDFCCLTGKVNLLCSESGFVQVYIS